ncbi:hypothetical protein ACNSTU_07240 [Aquisalimonas sp. APHAB1-3]|uniref:DUF7946 domain-containing protein n=1 Tax=Aquisalimonas sp. APHAB1-3 TaxID=3402080 RepID=UPI003AAA8005
MPSVQMKISYHYGDAGEGRLDLYDASVSLQGLARALAITTHALANEGEIRKQGDRARGVDIYVSPSRRGSFVEVVTIVFSNQVAQTIGASVLAAATWDLLKWSWSKTVDKEYRPSTPTVRRLEERKEPFIGEIEDALEVPLERFHRPIKKNEDVQISVKRPRGEEVLRLDQDTLASVSLQYDDNISRDIKANVTRYNILSGFGRFYVDGRGATVSFKLADDVPALQKELLTWSMDQANRGNEGKIRFDATTVMSAKGDIKRYIVHEIRREGQR